MLASRGGLDAEADTTANPRDSATCVAVSAENSARRVQWRVSVRATAQRALPYMQQSVSTRYRQFACLGCLLVFFFVLQPTLDDGSHQSTPLGRWHGHGTRWGAERIGCAADKRLCMHVVALGGGVLASGSTSFPRRTSVVRDDAAGLEGARLAVARADFTTNAISSIEPRAPACDGEPCLARGLVISAPGMRAQGCSGFVPQPSAPALPLLLRLVPGRRAHALRDGH